MQYATIRRSLWGLFWILVLGVTANDARAQDDVMMQAFYWDPPVDAQNLNGTWWDNLASKASDLNTAGITGIWTPPPSKGNFGIYDMGYAIYDHYDLGNYNQKGTVETRFGSRSELLNMVNTMHSNGIDVYADIILNHIYTSDAAEEKNPAVKTYIDNEAVVNGITHTTYPTNEVVWRIPDAEPGDYYIQVKGYNLDWGASKKERAYDVTINWDGSADNPNDPNDPNWEYEPNDGSGDFNVFAGSGEHVWAHIDQQSDVDEYKITLSATHGINLRLEARREVNGILEGASQQNGYRIVSVWHDGQNLASTTLQTRTNTGISYVNHTGAGEPNWTWNYSRFHPVDSNDFLEGSGFEDSIQSNWKLFGQDLNTFDAFVQNRMINWGQWLTNTVDYDGYRLDFVRGFQKKYAARWINNMPRRSDGSQRFAVGEYFTSHKYRLKNWVNDVYSFQQNGNHADVDVFDFPLKFTLTEMANKDGVNFDMSTLNHAGMVRDDGGNSLSGPSVVTFVDNHDTGKEHDKWVTRDWDMAHAYILFAEGRPCIFYPHYYGVTQEDQHDPSKSVTAPSGLQSDIDELIHIRNTYLGGDMIALSEIGNPYPSSDTYDVFVARRQGSGSKSGAILVLNSHETQTKGLWVDNAPDGGYENWSSKTLVNATSGNQEESQVYSDGRVYVSAPPRGYAVWLPKNEYVPYSGSLEEARPQAEQTDMKTKPTTFRAARNYPNPVRQTTTFTYALEETQHVKLRIYDAMGRTVRTLVNEVQDAGSHQVVFDVQDLPSGAYVYRFWAGNSTESRTVTVVH